jgi:hypothetical protein
MGDIEERRPYEGAPDMYMGTPVPESLKPDWDRPEADFWRLGVIATVQWMKEIYKFDTSALCAMADWDLKQRVLWRRGLR